MQKASGSERAAKNYAKTRYSGLDQIKQQNVKTLKEAWTFDTGTRRGQEPAPIVVGVTMYLVTPYPNILYALDLGKPGTVKWKYEPKPEPAAKGVACCDYVNRGAVYAHGKVFINTLAGTVTGVGPRPWGIGITPDGRTLYTANGPSDDVTVIDASTLSIVSRIKAGHSPWGIAVSN